MLTWSIHIYTHTYIYQAILLWNMDTISWRRHESERKWKLLSRVRLFATHGLYSPWNSPGQNTGVGSPSFLHWIFPTQGSNPGFLHCRQILYQLSHKGSPRILEWVADPFSRGTSWPRDWTRVSCIEGRFFITIWATREALSISIIYVYIYILDHHRVKLLGE